MPIFPERESIKIEERPEEITPLNIERKEVVTPVPTQFTKQVNDDQGKPVFCSPAVDQISIQLPAAPIKLAAKSKGSIDDSLTWLANYWLRMIKKAMHFGWKILGGDN